MTLSWKAVKALRNYAKAMPLAIKRMKGSGDDLKAVYQSVKEGLGPVGSSCEQIIAVVDAFVEDSSTSISILSRKCDEKADEIESFLSRGSSKNPS